MQIYVLANATPTLELFSRSQTFPKSHFQLLCEWVFLASLRRSAQSLFVVCSCQKIDKFCGKNSSHLQNRSGFAGQKNIQIQLCLHIHFSAPRSPVGRNGWGNKKKELFCPFLAGPIYSIFVTRIPRDFTARKARSILVLMDKAIYFFFSILISLSTKPCDVYPDTYSSTKKCQKSSQICWKMSISKVFYAVPVSTLCTKTKWTHLGPVDCAAGSRRLSRRTKGLQSDGKRKCFCAQNAKEFLHGGVIFSEPWRGTSKIWSWEKT